MAQINTIWEDLDLKDKKINTIWRVADNILLPYLLFESEFLNPIFCKIWEQSKIKFWILCILF